jgi:hypothetical protein
MHLLISIPAALLGSLLGSAVRGAVATAQDRVTGIGEEAAEPVVNVSISPVAGLVGGVAGGMLGVGTAFWIGALLGAAGMDRLDAKLLGQVGVDMDALVAKAVEVAERARRGGEDAAEAVVVESEAAEPETPEADRA